MKKEDLHKEPLKQFVKLWDSVKEQEFENGQMIVISTVSQESQPSSRIVLFKKITDQGIQFFCNYESRKAGELNQNPKASGLVYWPSQDIQIRFEGVVEKISESDSDEYFASRKRESQLGAWASKQSQRIEPPESLDGRVKLFDEKFSGQEVPRPAHWGGYIFKPHNMQILQRKGGRLNDSFIYERKEEGARDWEISLLYP